MVLSEKDAWETARKHYERQSMMFMVGLMRHLGLTQIELPPSVFHEVGTVEMTENFETGGRFYRIRGEFKLDAASTPNSQEKK